VNLRALAAYICAALFLLTSTPLSRAQETKTHDKTPNVRSEPSEGHHGDPGEAKITGDSKVGMMRGGFQILVNPGDEASAKAYYNRIEKLLGAILLDDAENPTPPPGGTIHTATTLDELLVYFGYQDTAGKGLKAEDLEKINSFVLMPRDSAEFNALDNATSSDVAGFLTLADFWDAATSRPKVLVSRFFAPKIATYYDAQHPFDPINPDDIVPGWRKVVRISPRAGSGAASAGLRHAYILFNFKEKDAAKDPFADNKSSNNQVILVPENFNPSSPQTDSCYFLVYLSSSDSYKIGLFLAADFDLPGHVAYQTTTTPALDSHYYVPTACAACHGHGDYLGAPTQGDLFTLAKSNYLDTDQWYDWMDFDFHGVAGSLNDVVFDGGKDPTSANYKRALNVISALNLGVKEETQRVENPPSFGTKAVQKWLDIHQVNVTTKEAADPLRKPYSSRALPSASAGWDPANPKEMRLLRLLDNHCFRCHSSMIYNVFDKGEVGQRADLIVTFLNELKVHQGVPLPGFTMPQGRVLPNATRAEMTQLVYELFPTSKKMSLLTGPVALSIVARSYAFKINGVDNPNLEVKEGETVSITMTSAGGTHDWRLEDTAGTVVTKSQTVSGSTPIIHSFVVGAPGTYTYFCGIGNHRQRGMEGALKVVPK
jgi:plastocyanin